MKLIIREAEAGSTQQAGSTTVTAGSIPNIATISTEIKKFGGKSPYNPEEIQQAYTKAEALIKEKARSFDSNMAFAAYIAGAIDGDRLNRLAAEKANIKKP
jgi:hypothetical protein